MRIIFCNNELELHPSGVLLWSAQKLLVVSDLHLEKSSYYVRRGFFLPPYESHTDLKKLHEILRRTGMERILILGDCFHDNQGYGRLRLQDHALFDALMQYEPIWIKGNHDSEFLHPDMTAHESYKIGNLIFRHEAEQGAQGEISGHFHPKATIGYKGGLITRPCFLSDQRRIILPSFGSYTGGLDIQHPAIAKNFPGPFNIFLSGGNKIYAFKADGILPGSH